MCGLTLAHCDLLGILVLGFCSSHRIISEIHHILMGIGHSNRRESMDLVTVVRFNFKHILITLT